MKLPTTRSHILEKADIYTADFTKTLHLTTRSTTLILFLFCPFELSVAFCFWTWMPPVSANSQKINPQA